MICRRADVQRGHAAALHASGLPALLASGLGVNTHLENLREGRTKPEFELFGNIVDAADG